MASQLTSMELAEVGERLELFNSIPPEERTEVFGIAPREPCEESAQVFVDAQDTSPADQTMRVVEHYRQCVSCGEFLRFVWALTGKHGY